MQLIRVGSLTIQPFPVSKNKSPQSFGTASPTFPNLPNELWVEICLYLSPEVVVKMIGLNRVFFEHAMDIVYRTISVVDAEDEVQNWRLMELHKETIASRVHHIRIVPRFLPLRARDGKPLLQEHPQVERDFLTKRLKVLYNCQNLNELTLEMNFKMTRIVTVPFCDFLNSLIFRSGRVRTLSLTMGTDQLRVLSALSSRYSLTSSFTSITLTLMPPRIHEPSPRPARSDMEGFIDHLSSFLNNTRHSLETLIIMFHVCIDFSALLRRLETFTSLKKIHYQYNTGIYIHSFPETINSLFKLSPNLLSLSFTAVLSHSTLTRGPTKVVFNKNTNEHGSLYLQLPGLHGSILENILFTFVTFGCFVKHLVIESTHNSTYLQFQQVLGVIARLSQKQDGVNRVETLEFRRLELFSAIHLDEVLRRLPHLKVLNIGYEQLSISPLSRERSPHQTKAEWDRDLENSFRSHTYPHSKLERLYIRKCRCQIGSTGCISTFDKPPSRLLKSLVTSLSGVSICGGSDPGCTSF